jgi:hypothetical protein
MHPETRTRTATRENSTLKKKTEGVKANQKKRFPLSPVPGAHHLALPGEFSGKKLRTTIFSRK